MTMDPPNIRRMRLIRVGRATLLLIALLAAQVTLAGHLGPDRTATVRSTGTGSGGERAAAASRGAASVGRDPSRAVEQPSGPDSGSDERSAPSVDVRAFGARGDGVTNDTAAIQTANDSVASRGGGSVFFPRGTYVAVGVVQDSNVAFVGEGDATLRHPNGVTPRPIIGSRTFSTTGSISAGSRTLVVSDARGIERGSVIAIRGAGGPSLVQYSALEVASVLSEDRLKLADTAGFGPGPNHVLVGSEVVTYERDDLGWLVGVRRGLLGTTPMQHPAGERVSQLRVHYAIVRDVVGTSVTLDRPAEMSVSGAPVESGSRRLTVTGLTFDGHRIAAPQPLHPVALSYALARDVTIARCTVRNGGHGAVVFDRGTRDSVVRDSVLLDSGAPAQRLGAAIWVFRGSSNNVIDDNRIGNDSYIGVAIDDRSIGSSEWDADSTGNRVVDNRIDIPSSNENTAVLVSNSTDNLVFSNDLGSAFFGVQVLTPGQGTQPSAAEANTVRDNSFSGHDVGIYVTGSRNRFTGNTFSDVDVRIVDEGEGNMFAG